MYVYVDRIKDNYYRDRFLEPQNIKLPCATSVFTTHSIYTLISLKLI